jgi:hypothetical protein
LAFVNISCNENDDLESFIETSEKEKAAAKTMAKGNIKRTRMKERRNGLYRISVVVDKDNKNTVSTVALEIESKKGLIPETKTYYLDYFTTIKGKKYYTYADIKFENPDVVNQEVNIKVTLLDADKKPISTSTGTTVIAGLSNANIKPSRTRIKQRRNGLYKMTAEIDNNEDNEVADVEISANDLQGNTTTFNTNPNKNNTINANVSFEKESTANKFVISYILKDMFGDVVGESKEEVLLTPNFKIGKVSLNRTSEGLYTALVKVKNDTGNDVDKVTVTIEKGEGIAEETITYDLTYLKTKKGVKFYTNQKVALIESNIKKIPVVVKIYAPYENVVISHKILIEKDLEKQRQEILKN